MDALESSLRSLLYSEEDGDPAGKDGQDVVPSFFLTPMPSPEEWFRKVLLVEDDQVCGHFFELVPSFTIHGKPNHR